MLFFGHDRLNFRLNEDKILGKELRAFFQHPKTQSPARKPVCVMHPENTPRTIHDSGFPKDFPLYEYAGAMLTVLGIKGSDGSFVRRPALVAKMVRKYRMDDGASVQVEMTASLSDLKRGNHPHAISIAAALTMYYEEKVLRKETIVETPARAPVDSWASGLSANDFFAKVDYSRY